MRRTFVVLAVVAAGLFVSVGVLGGARPATAAAARQPSLPTLPTEQPPPADHTPKPTPPPHETPPPDQPPPTAAPTFQPTDPPLQSTAPVPTGPAVGTLTTPQGLLSVPAATLGPTPQQSGGDVTLLIVLVIIVLALTAIGAFVLAIALQ